MGADNEKEAAVGKDANATLTWLKPSQLKFSLPAVAAAMAAFVVSVNAPMVPCLFPPSSGERARTFSAAATARGEYRRRRRGRLESTEGKEKN